MVDPDEVERYEKRIVAAMQDCAKALIKNKGHGNQSAAERATGVKQQVLSGVARGEQIGIRSLVTLALACGVGLDELVADPSGIKAQVHTVVPLRLGEASGWFAALDEAKARYESIPEWAWQQAASVALPVIPGRLSSEFVRDVARLLADHCSDTGVRKIRRKRR